MRQKDAFHIHGQNCLRTKTNINHNIFSFNFYISFLILDSKYSIAVVININIQQILLQEKIFNMLPFYSIHEYMILSLFMYPEPEILKIQENTTQV